MGQTALQIKNHGDGEIERSTSGMHEWRGNCVKGADTYPSQLTGRPHCRRECLGDTLNDL